MCLETFNNVNKSDFIEGEETLTKLFYKLLAYNRSVQRKTVTSDSRMLQYCQDFGQRFSLYGFPSHLANNMHISKN